MTWAPADLSAGAGPVLDVLPAVDAIVHAAAARSVPTGEGPGYLWRVNVDFTNALFAWAWARPVAVVVYLSGLNFLRRPLNPEITEDHPLDPATPYAATKYRGE